MKLSIDEAADVVKSEPSKIADVMDYHAKIAGYSKPIGEGSVGF